MIFECFVVIATTEEAVAPSLKRPARNWPASAFMQGFGTAGASQLPALSRTLDVTTPTNPKLHASWAKVTVLATKMCNDSIVTITR